MKSYIVLWDGFWSGTIALEAASVRLAFLAMLQCSDEEGEFNQSVGSLAVMAHISLEESSTAFETLSRPDPGSKSLVEEGRRIMAVGDPVENRWRIVNFTKYRDEMRKLRDRKYKRDWWEKNRGKSRLDGPRDSISSLDAPRVKGKGKGKGKGKEREIEKGKERKKKKEGGKGGVESVAMPEGLDNEKFRAKWAEWLDYRKTTRKKPVSPLAAKKALNKLASVGAEVAAEAIDLSIENDWQGVDPAWLNGRTPRRGGKARQHSTVEATSSAERRDRLKERAIKVGH